MTVTTREPSLLGAVLLILMTYVLGGGMREIREQGRRALFLRHMCTRLVQDLTFLLSCCYCLCCRPYRLSRYPTMYKIDLQDVLYLSDEQRQPLLDTTLFNMQLCTKTN